jgi:hypothetical protein
MAFFRNRHMVVATLMAPVLALISYFAVDAMFSEDPQPAEQGQSYPLVEKPGCRYGSGQCALENGEFKLELRIEPLGGDRRLLRVSSAFPLEGVMVAVVAGELEKSAPRAMDPDDGDGLAWSLELPATDPELDRLRLVASADGSLYFGDAATRFTAPEDGP